MIHQLVAVINQGFVQAAHSRFHSFFVACDGTDQLRFDLLRPALGAELEQQRIEIVFAENLGQLIERAAPFTHYQDGFAVVDELGELMDTAEL